MITVRLRGGLGNQMFQYATGRRVAERSGQELALDLTLLLDHAPSRETIPRDYDLDIFEGIQAKPTLLSRAAMTMPATPGICRRASQIVTRCKSIAGVQQRVVESGFRFDPRVLELTGNVYLDGYWQSAQYFADVDMTIRREFSLGPIADAAVAAMADSIGGSNAVCLNVRRGDFVDHAASARAHGFVGAEYYAAGISFISQRVQNPHFFIFSDDMEWCRAHLAPAAPHTFVGREYSGRKFKDYLRLMSRCKHFLIPNSTFAWWAAWLSTSPERVVIAPKRWFADPTLDASDIYVDSWVRL